MSTTTSTETRAAKSMSSSGSVPLRTIPITTATTDTFLPSSSTTNATAGPSSASTVSTLRSLYPRAAHALLQRDFALTHTLLDSAFELLTPPSGGFPIPDTLDTHRRKWDILRITLETSAFASPPTGKHAAADAEVLPPALRANLMLSAQGLVTALHTRSVRLFTPESQNPNAAFLPAQILVLLIFSSLKLHCPDVGRNMIVDWLAQRKSIESTRDDAEGYERVLELFCLHVLPRLHEWEYAQQFLEYESELSEKSRQHLKSTLQVLQTQEIEAARSIPSPPPLSSPSTPSTGTRTPSPSPSVESNSSSDTDDTHSTRTVVPHTPRAKYGMNGLTPLTPTPSISSTSLLDSKHTNGHVVPEKRAVSPASTARVSHLLSGRHSTVGADAEHRVVGARTPPSTLALVMTALRAHLAQLGTSRLLFALLCVLVPVLSFLLRLQRRRRQQTGGAPRTGVDAVRRRLVGQPRAGVLGMIWAEIARAVGDAVRMAGGGLV